MVDATIKRSTASGDPYTDPNVPVQGTPTNTPTPCASCTATPTRTSTATRTNSPTATLTPCGGGGNYSFATATGTIVPGTNDILVRGRPHVDAAMEHLLQSADDSQIETLAPAIVLGLNHEQQHQELMLTDVKHAFWMNPLRPVFRAEGAPAQNSTADPGWLQFDAGLYSIGFEGEDFCFETAM